MVMEFTETSQCRPETVKEPKRNIGKPKNRQNWGGLRELHRLNLKNKGQTFHVISICMNLVLFAMLGNPISLICRRGFVDII